MTAATTAPSPLTFDVNGTEVTFQPRTWRHYVPHLLTVAAILALVAVLALPEVALADPISDWFNGVMASACTAVINASMGFVNSIEPAGLALNDFNNLFGSGDVSLYQMAESISNVSIKPVAASVLALVILAQLIKIAQRVDANATMPALKEVMILFFYFVVGMYLVRHGVELVGDVYDIFRSFIAGITAGAKDVEILFDPEGMDVGSFFGVLLSSGIVLVGSAIASVLANAMFLARAIQIYLYAAFAPLMFSFFGVDETRGWSLGFLKGFMAACLSGFIIYFSIAAFPYILTSLLSTSMSTATDTTIYVVASGGDNSTWVLMIAAACFSLGLMCLKSGTFAREILGG